MIRHSKELIFKTMMALVLAVFLMGVTGCCPGGPGCDWYSSDHETPQKQENQ